MSKILFPEVKVKIWEGSNVMTVGKAKDILGWTEEPKEGSFKSDYTLKDLQKTGVKVRLSNNQTNRPFRMSLAVRYANEILRNKWKLNGETVVIDRHGKVQSGQHRLTGLVLAEQLRLKNPERWEEYGWKGPVHMATIVVTGISEKPDTVDTLDLGQKRTLGDVIFRNQEFQDATDRDSKRLSNVLAGGTRLAWLRSGGQTVSDAPHFPPSEALDFIEDHPGLVESTKFIFNENGTENLIGTFISLGYAAGLCYLMATSGTDPDEFHNEGIDAIDLSLKDKAEEFWVLFAQGANLPAGSAILALRQRLLKIDASGAMGRDEIIGTVIKAFNIWADGKKVKTVRDVTILKKKNDDGKLVLAETPRLGGLDADVEWERDEDEGAEEGDGEPTAEDVQEAPTKAAKGSKGKKAPKPGKKAGKPKEALPDIDPGTTVTVKDDEGDWQGTAGDTYDRANGKVYVTVTSEDDGEEYEIPRELISA